MLKPYELLDGVLNEIENSLKEKINENSLAKNFSISSVHLRRLFKFAFGKPLGTYIRSRKLAASIEDLLLTDNNILDIVLDYGLEYEQSYNRAFKREFGITPGKLRKSGQIIKITPPLQLFDSNRFGDGLIFGPDIVMVPKFHVVGKRYKIPSASDPTPLLKSLIKQFFSNERQKIPNVVNPDVFFNICSYSNADMDSGIWYFMPAFQVKTHENIPEGYEGYTFPTSLCANFHFIYYGFNLKNYNIDEINMNIEKFIAYPDDMFKAVDDFMDSKDHKYFLDRKLNINKFIFSRKNENYLQLEWFSPVNKKTVPF